MAFKKGFQKQASKKLPEAAHRMHISMDSWKKKRNFSKKGLAAMLRRRMSDG